MPNKFRLKNVSLRLVKDAPIYSEEKIDSPEAAVRVLGEYLCQMPREYFCVVCLKSDGTPINVSILSIGTINASLVSPAEIFKVAMLSNAANIILVHNHPSGYLQPSREDIIATDRVIKVGNLIGIPVSDHIIVGGDNSSYFSMHEKHLLTTDRCCLVDDINGLTFGSDTIPSKVAEE